MSQFDELLAQLQAQQEEAEVMTKAMTGKIQAAAGNPEDEEEDYEDADGEDEDEDEEDDDEGETMTKSVMMDGEEFTVVDAELMVKSISELADRLEANETGIMAAITAQSKIIEQQALMIKSMHERIDSMASAGRGRKSHQGGAFDRQAAAAPKSSVISTMGELMAKAEAAATAGKISWDEFSRLDTIVRTPGATAPVELLAKIAQ